MTADYFETAAALFEDFSLAPLKSEEELWDYLIRKAASAVECHAATIFEADEIKKTLTFKKSIGPVGRELEGLSFGYQGIAGWCAENKRPILVNDTESDLRFTKKVDYGTGFKTKNVIAVPASSGGKLLGVAEFINSVRGSFSETDLKLASMLTAFVARDVYISRLEATVKQLSLRGENTINNLSGGFIGVDMDGKVIFFNPKAKEIFGSGDDYLNQNIISFFHVSPDIVAAIGDVLKEGRTVKRKEFKCAVNGADKIIGYSSINIKGVDGKVIGAGVLFQDITNL
ncbi:MAG: GAF domain-containing protein [Elusimicrobia bacterium]|nr:GAF domain-containing protein [Elusimicrobiota bacterium]